MNDTSDGQEDTSVLTNRINDMEIQIYEKEATITNSEQIVHPV